jgi:hypothetical protein
MPLEIVKLLHLVLIFLNKFVVLYVLQEIDKQFWYTDATMVN